MTPPRESGGSTAALRLVDDWGPGARYPSASGPSPAERASRAAHPTQARARHLAPVPEPVVDLREVRFDLRELDQSDRAWVGRTSGPTSPERLAPVLPLPVPAPAPEPPPAGGPPAARGDDEVRAVLLAQVSAAKAMLVGLSERLAALLELAEQEEAAAAAAVADDSRAELQRSIDSWMIDRRRVLEADLAATRRAAARRHAAAAEVRLTNPAAAGFVRRPFASTSPSRQMADTGLAYRPTDGAPGGHDDRGHACADDLRWPSGLDVRR